MLPNYLFVDLDGTLIRTDVLYEAALRYIRRNPFHVIRLIQWCLGGRASLKSRLAEKVDINPSTLPYEEALVSYLREQRDQGRTIVLATATHRKYASQISEHLGIFSDVIATEVHVNRKGEQKLAAIRELIGDAKFSYAGNGTDDRILWNAAATRVFVNASEADVGRAEEQNCLEKVVRPRTNPVRAFIREMRIPQWTKNFLVFVPLLTSHSYANFGSTVSALVAFVAFCLCASGVYFINDLLDLEADRGHARKRERPLASGQLPLSAGVLGGLALPLLAFAISSSILSLQFVAVLAVYFALTLAYSFFLKRISTADVMTLSVLYSLRVGAGAVAIGATLSSWLMAFSIFMFVSLAYLKRYVELRALDDDANVAAGRGYSAADSETMYTLGIANATASVVVLALYVSSDEVAQHYGTPALLWALCFLVLYWTNRVWVGARRGKIAEDPIIFAIRDPVSRLVGLAFVVIVILARFKY